MKRTERAAYEWLLRYGYTPDQIAFTGAISPDFRTTDGKGWEIKKMVSRTVILFGVSQIRAIRESGLDTSVVVMAYYHSTEPCLVLPFEDIPMPGITHGLLIRVVYQPSRSLPSMVHSAAELDACLADHRREHPRMRNYRITYGAVA